MKKINSYSHLTKTERLEIAVLKEKRYSLREIARVLKRSPGTLSDEIKRNGTRGKYDPEKANHKSYVKRKYSKYQGMKIAGQPKLRAYVEDKIQNDWSPEEVSGRLKEIDNHLPYASFRVVYKFIYSVYGRLLEKHLRYKGQKRKPKNTPKVTQPKDRIFIDKRPKIVEEKRRFGDWEGDFIVSGKNGKGILIVLHERKARYVLIRKLVGVTIEQVHQFIWEMTGGYVINTLTLDNDIVFRKHKELSKILGAPIYFCHPYHSWEKGGVENSNKLIRQYIPKRSDISQYSDKHIQMVQDKLNNRPRKCLKYKTPSEVMKENRQMKYEIYDMMKLLAPITHKTKTAECSA